MDFSWREEDELLRETVRRYATERLAPDYARWESEPFPRERVVELGDLGVLGMLIPEEFGGSAGGYISLGIAAEYVYRLDALDEASAIEFFAAQARRADPTFELSLRNRAATYFLVYFLLTTFYSPAASFLGRPGPRMEAGGIEPPS